MASSRSKNSEPVIWIAIWIAIASHSPFARAEESCASCHYSLERVSKSHAGCVACHGGDPGARSAARAHSGMHGESPGRMGAAHPASPESWEKSCGYCHPWHLERVKSSVMTTASGMIRNIRLSWDLSGTGVGPERVASRPATVYDEKGKPLLLRGISENEELAGELYRKFCARCHVGLENGDSWRGAHGSGCAACHFPYNDEGIYSGKDPAARGRGPFSASHEMAVLPDTQVCTRCHHRSGRIGLSYQGLQDGNNSLVPTRDGRPGPEQLSGGRNAVHVDADVHFSAGMDCIDCHTSRDVMGDGYSHENMYQQIEVTCEDCHGGYARKPRWAPILLESDSALRESWNYKVPARPGQQMILTSRGRKYSNVFVENGQVFLRTKRTGKLLKVKVITGSAEHRIPGHSRMECYACHSRQVPQCFGCHTQYDKRELSKDYIKGYETPGEFSETEDYRMSFPFALAVNQRGKISPVTPGCQTFVTVIDENGAFSRKEEVATFRGKRQLRFAPFYSHNTGKKAVTCVECHSDPFFSGLGRGVIGGADFEPTLLCECASDKPLDGFVRMKSGRMDSFAAVVRENSRPLSPTEIKQVFSVNLCLVCHDRAKDPIYRKELDYRVLEDKLHRKLLGNP